MAKLRKHDSRNIEDLLVQEGEGKFNTEFSGKTEKVGWDVKETEVHSDVKLENDLGTGKHVLIRSFDFSANPETFKMHVPTKQELLNAHAKEIEIALWRDGLKVMPDVNPQVKISKNKRKYRIVVGAEPQRGQMVSWKDQEQFKTLSQIANESRTNTK